MCSLPDGWVGLPDTSIIAWRGRSTNPVDEPLVAEVIDKHIGGVYNHPAQPAVGHCGTVVRHPLATSNEAWVGTPRPEEYTTG